LPNAAARLDARRTDAARAPPANRLTAKSLQFANLCSFNDFEMEATTRIELV
jgi:hypothetical protein